MIIDKDAFSNGQIDSKLWLCEKLENFFNSIDTVWIYGGWYGITAFLLKSRNNLQIKTIRSFDIDPACEAIADAINENWVFKEWQFKAQTVDCNELQPKNVDLIINTSVEHFHSIDWWNKIPKGSLVALQGNNMIHTDHVIHFKNLEDFSTHFILENLIFKGEKEFVYPTWSFSRFMLIGYK